MYKTVPEAINFARELKVKSIAYNNVDIVIAPPYTALTAVHEVIKDSKIKMSAQNIHWAEEGAYTGEVSTLMLESTGCVYTIIGHSERRQYFSETDAIINKKLLKTLSSKLLPILCVGETLEQRKSGKTEQVVDLQVRQALANVDPEKMKRVTIAYEPVWAIGTGENATPEQAQEVHAFIRNLISELYNFETASSLRIQYGGSVKPSNAVELLHQPDIDGALIGGASLKIDSFLEIIKVADQIKID